MRGEVTQREPDGEMNLRLVDQRHRAPQQRVSRLPVAAPIDALPGRCESPRSLLSKSRIGSAELSKIERSLLEVVAEDLVQLDQIFTVLLQPLGEAPVKVGARRLREGVVGGVADQEVAEAIGVLARKLRPVRADEVAPHERGESRGELRLLRCKGLHSAAVEK